MRRLAWSAWLIGISSVAWVTYLENSYASNMPRRADLSAGRTVRIVVKHGAHVFVAPEEATRLDGARSRMNVGIVSLVIGTIAAAATLRGRSEFPDAG
jgi:hypothetical protein